LPFQVKFANSSIVLTLCTALALAACGRSEAPRKNRAADPHYKQQLEMEKGMGFKKIVIVRLQSEGKRVEVTSILPAEIAEVNVKGEIAKTIIRVNDTEDGLVFFSRDVPKGTSYHVEVKFAELERNKAVVFPVLQPDGSLKERSFSLEQIAIPQ
jgi:hypothetical protein